MISESQGEVCILRQAPAPKPAALKKVQLELHAAKLFGLATYDVEEVWPKFRKNVVAI